MLLTLAVHVHLALLRASDLAAASGRRRLADQRGQTSAEYALVLFGVAAIAMLIHSWAKSTGKVGDLLDAVFDNVVEMVS